LVFQGFNLLFHGIAKPVCMLDNFPFYVNATAHYSCNFLLLNPCLILHSFTISELRWWSLHVHQTTARTNSISVWQFVSNKIKEELLGLH